MDIDNMNDTDNTESEKLRERGYVRHPKMATSKRVTLQNCIREIVFQGSAGTHQKIRARLEEMGHSITQSSLSRILRKIGAVKSTDEEGNIVYRMPREPLPPSPDNSLQSLVVNVLANESTIVVHTSPGAAQLVARVLDYKKEFLGVLGTIAGDDIIFVAPVSQDTIRETMEKVKDVVF